MTAWDLAGLLDPIPVERFLSSVYGQSWCFIPGSPLKFDGLFSWEDVNRILREHHLDWINRDRDGATDRRRFGMVREGSNLHNDPLVGTSTAPDRTRRQRVDVTQLNHRMRDGATLYSGELDVYDERLACLAEAVGRALGERVSIGMHAVTQPVSGRRGHSDAFDIFALQLGGRKRWQLRGRDEKKPIIGHPVTPNLSPRPVEFDHVLDPGDVLYVPAGWWHDVCAVDEPSLHVNVTIQPRSGVHFLEWIRSDTTSLRSFLDAASADGTDDGEILSVLREDIAAMLGPGSLNRFLTEQAKEVSHANRPSYCFPDVHEPDRAT